MNESYYALEVVMKQRQRDVLREADQRRLARAGSNAPTSARAPVFAPVLARVGRLLVAAGRRLETRAAQASIRGANRACGDCLPESPA